MAEPQSLYEASSPNVSLSVSPYFREDVLKRGNTRRVAERLAKLVAQIAPAAPTDGQAVTIVRADWDALDHAGLGEVLVDLTVLRLPGTSRTLWPPPVGGYLNTDGWGPQGP